MTLKFKPFLFVGIGAAVFLSILVLFVLPAFKKGTPAPKKVSAVLDKQTQIEREIKGSFTSAQDQNTISFLNLAVKETDPVRKYGYFVKVYTKTVSTYNISKNPAQRLAINDLAVYAKTLPGYKEGDFKAVK